MKRYFTLALILSYFSVAAQQLIFDDSDWENPAIFQKGQQAPHAFHVPFNSLDEALAGNEQNSGNYMLLNGLWKFRWFERPELVPENFYVPDFSTIEWDEIIVPSNWQMQGYGHAKFRNIALTFENDPPNIPDYYNPTGAYKRDFNLPDTWKNKQVILRFEGVKSASYVWVNGYKVGYNQGGFEPAEYDITPYIKVGENNISVKVLRFCDGSYLENQDMWRLSGIFRDVKLYALPKVNIHDFYFRTNLDKDYKNAELLVDVNINNSLYKNISGLNIKIDVLNEKNNSILSMPITQSNIDINAGSDKKIELSTMVNDPLKWSAEYPNLYNISFELKNIEGITLETFVKKIGFVEVEVVNERILVNGIPVKLNGVNSHMHHPDLGQAVPLETLKKDLILMKQFNINCVRTSHYPPTPEYLDLANELGIYVFNEVSDEAHNNISLSYDTAWTEMYLDRCRKLVYRDRNHPSVLAWSAGNESGSGENINEVIKMGKLIDPSRPAWMYGGNTFYIPFEDITGPRYWPPYQLKNLAERKVLGNQDLRPSFMDEYLAATGNGLGGLDEYWDLIWKYPRLSGGAIWDWVSPGITTPLWVIPDGSSNNNNGAIMGKPSFIEGKNGRALSFTGHDDWVEFYRDSSLDITGNELIIAFWVKPEELTAENTFITKGKHQYGIIMDSPTSIEFYIQRNNLFGIHNFYVNPILESERISAKATIPKNWYGNWHHVIGCYNGENVELYIDQQKVASTKYNGVIASSPFALCIGRDAETQDQGEFSGRISKMAIDDVKIFDKVVPVEKLVSGKMDSLAVLLLDFEKDEKGDNYFSVGLGGRTYGIVWPNREIQPEIYQIKKSGQPINVTMVDPKKGIVNIINRHQFKNLNEFYLHWQILKDGYKIYEDKMIVDLAAQKQKELTIPYSISNVEGEVILTVSFCLRKQTNWAEENHEVAWNQFVLKEAEANKKNIIKGGISFKDNKDDIVIKGKDFVYNFDKNQGQFSQLNYKNLNYLENTPFLNFWRAPISNDLDPWGAYFYNEKNTMPGLGRSIDNQLRTLGFRNPVVQIDSIKTEKDENSDIVIYVYKYINSSNNRGALECFEKHSIKVDGTITMEIEITPHGTLPEMLPRAGLQFQMPKEFKTVNWYGRGSFETYPDRKSGAKIGIYASDIDKEYVPYLMPQDYGNHTDVRWLKLSNSLGRGLLVKSDELLNFSLQKYSTENLSRAMHTYQLKEASFNTLNVDFEISGVGGTAIRQLQKYRVLPGKKTYNLIIKPF